MANNSWIRSYFWKGYVLGGGCDIHHNFFSNAPVLGPYCWRQKRVWNQWRHPCQRHGFDHRSYNSPGRWNLGKAKRKVLQAIPMKNVRTKTWILIWIYWNHPKMMSSLLKWHLHWQDHFPFKQKMFISGKIRICRDIFVVGVGESAK